MGKKKQVTPKIKREKRYLDKDVFGGLFYDDPEEEKEEKEEKEVKSKPPAFVRTPPPTPNKDK